MSRPETPAEERKRRIAEKLGRQGMSMRPDEAEVQNQKQRDRERKRREDKTHITVTWLDPPVRPVKGWRVAIVGVCSGCDPETKALYL